jgi:hypothetical protein
LDAQTISRVLAWKVPGATVEIRDNACALTLKEGMAVELEVGELSGKVLANGLVTRFSDVKFNQQSGVSVSFEIV